MTTTLAFDTSQQWCCVAVSQNGKILSHQAKAMTTGHSEALLPMIMETLDQAGLKTSDLNRIATIIGPGSFTGLRISLATAQGMGQALGIPIIGIDTFHAYRACIQTRSSLLVAIDSQKQDVYCQLFAPDGREIEPAVAMDPKDLFTYTANIQFDVTGNGAYKLDLTDSTIHLITPDTVCQNLSLIDENHTSSEAPLYLKDPIPLMKHKVSKNF